MRSTMNDRTASSERVALLLVVSATMVLRLWHATNDPLIYNDGPEFIAIANGFLAGELSQAISHAFHPMTSALIALVVAATGLDPETAGRAVSIAGSGAAAAALYLLAHRLFGRSVAVVAGMLFAVHPRMVAVGSGVQSDGLHLAFFLWGALAAWRTLDGGRLWLAVTAGFATGLAYLTRPEGVAVGVVFLGWLAYDVASRRVPAARVLKLAFAFLGTLLLVAAPYLFSLRTTTGTWTLTQKKDLGEIMTFSPEATSTLPDSEGAAEALQEVIIDGFRAMMPVFGALGLLGLASIGRPRSVVYLLSFGALFFIVLLGVRLEADYISRRHWLAPVALALPLVAQGLLHLSQLVGQRVARSFGLPGGAVAILVAVIGGSAVLSGLPPTELDKLARKEAALWLRNHRRPSAVAAHRAREAYYAGARHVPFAPLSPGPGLLPTLAERGAEFLILDETRVVAALGAPPPAGSVVHRVDYSGGSVLVIRLGAGAGHPSQ